jgi:hypothetical protein
MMGLGRSLVRHSAVERLPRYPFGPSPRASRETYLALAEAARSRSYPEIDALEHELGFAVDTAWLDDLALHTQVVVKASDICYQHGRILYAALRHRLTTLDGAGLVRCFETGTARGFSALCQAKALADHQRPGEVISVDVLPHRDPIYWNCIDDHEGPKTRHALLEPWSPLRGLVLFLQGDTRVMVERIAVDRLHFAFLDARHTFEDVMREIAFVADRQALGDVIVFDDVTPSLFPGVVRAVDAIVRNPDHPYEVRRIRLTDQRGYAIATRRPAA